MRDFSWFTFEDGSDLLSANLYALSLNPQCPACAGVIASPEPDNDDPNYIAGTTYTTGWVNMRLEDRTVPLPSNLALLGIGLPLLLAMRWRSRRRRGLVGIAR